MHGFVRRPASRSGSHSPGANCFIVAGVASHGMRGSIQDASLVFVSLST